MNNKIKKLLTLSVLSSALLNYKVAKADYNATIQTVDLTYTYATDSISSSPIQIKTTFRDPSCAYNEFLAHAYISYSFDSTLYAQNIYNSSILYRSCQRNSRVVLTTDADATADLRTVRQFCKNNGSGTHWSAFTLDASFYLESTTSTSGSVTNLLTHTSGTQYPVLPISFNVTCDFS